MPAMKARHHLVGVGGSDVPDEDRRLLVQRARPRPARHPDLACDLWPYRQGLRKGESGARGDPTAT